MVSGTVGAGGMGEVYRARDPRLEPRRRDQGASTRAAPTRRASAASSEAQAASALNHPNIVTVYDVGVAGRRAVHRVGAGRRDVAAELLARAPLPVREVLDLAVQMADGLAAAHEAGIVHRDFKPENVMVTREGASRFSTSVSRSSARATASPRRRRDADAAGVIVGHRAVHEPRAGARRDASTTGPISSRSA